VFAPGRVNLIGEHVDYCGGPVLPIAIELGTTVEAVPAGGPTHLESDQATPGWTRYVDAVEAEVGAGPITGTVATTLPVGAGLSSSAALIVALALAFGAGQRGTELALLAQRAETRACGLPCGIMDPLASIAGAAGFALLIDCATLDTKLVPMPEDFDVLVVHSGQDRTLATSAYAERRAQCEQAAAALGPLPDQAPGAEAALADPVIRRRARHVITECERVRAVVGAPADHAVWREVLAAGHASLRDDFEVSTPAVEETVAGLTRQPAVIGARLTGGGFGGCVVALVERGAPIERSGHRAWLVHPSDGARFV
jgi:galactokinase